MGVVHVCCGLKTQHATPEKAGKTKRNHIYILYRAIDRVKMEGEMCLKMEFKRPGS